MNWGWEAISTALGGLWFLMRISFRVGEGVKGLKHFQTTMLEKTRDHEDRIGRTEKVVKIHGKKIRKVVGQVADLKEPPAHAPLPA